MLVLALSPVDLFSMVTMPVEGDVALTVATITSSAVTERLKSFAPAGNHSYQAWKVAVPFSM